MNTFLIGDFEGPLDLLLHLVKKQEMDISELSLIDITEQYINFIKEMEDMNLTIADLEENPEEELKRRLLEYQKYKESVSSFRVLEDNRSKYYTKMPEKREIYTSDKLENTMNLTAYDLLNALQKLLERKEYSKPLNTKITKKELSVSDRVAKIRSVLKKEKRIEFYSLFEEVSKPYVVVTFLGILEMAKNREIVLKQDENFGTIVLERVDLS